MAMLPDIPIELDIGYVRPTEPIERMVRARAARLGEWVQGFPPVANGDEEIRRGVGPILLGRVENIKEGDGQTGGYDIRIWSIVLRCFVERMFLPNCCVLSRVSVNYYSLTGEWPKEWNVT